MDESPFLPSRSIARRVNPIATLKIAVDARRSRKSVHIDLLIAKPNSFFVEKSKGLREPAWLRIPRRYGRFHHIKLVFVHIDSCKGTGLVGVRKAQLVSFDELEEIPLVLGHLRVALHEFPRCVDQRGSSINLPPTLPGTTDSFAHDIAGRTTFGLLRENGLHLIVIDHRNGVAALALCDAIHARGKIGSVFRSISCLGYLRLLGEETRESVFAAGKLHPFLGEQGPRKKKHENHRNPCFQMHIRLSVGERSLSIYKEEGIVNRG